MKFLLPFERPDKCCWCFPFKMGVYLMGAITFLTSLSMVSVCLYYYMLNKPLGICLLVFDLLSVLATAKYAMWLYHDSQESR